MVATGMERKGNASPARVFDAALHSSLHISLPLALSPWRISPFLRVSPLHPLAGFLDPSCPEPKFTTHTEQAFGRLKISS